jgi:hypothetical protein
VTFSFSCFIIYRHVIFIMTLCTCYPCVLSTDYFIQKCSSDGFLFEGVVEYTATPSTAYIYAHCVNYDDGESFNLFPDQFFKLLSTPGAIKLKRSLLPLSNLSGSRRLLSIFHIFSLPLSTEINQIDKRGPLFIFQIIFLYSHDT